MVKLIRDICKFGRATVSKPRQQSSVRSQRVGFSKVHQLGISLLEVMLSISVIALILVMATRFFYVANNNNKVNMAISQIAGLDAAIHSWKGGSLDYTDLSIQELFKAGELTNFPGVSADGNELYSPWGQKKYSVAPAAAGGGAVITVDIDKYCGRLKKAFGTHGGCDGSNFTYTVD